LAPDDTSKNSDRQTSTRTTPGMEKRLPTGFNPGPVFNLEIGCMNKMLEVDMKQNCQI
jgi:hypothetical protein